MTTDRDSACRAIRPLLFAAIDGEIQHHERLEVHAHLAYCEACRSWERGERALTALLSDGRDAARRRNPVPAARGPRRWRARLAAAGAALLVASLVLLVLPSATPRGSLVQRQLGPHADWHVADERGLAANDDVVVPAAAAVTVQLEGAQLDCVGPARFSLEASGGRWRVAVREGAVRAVVRA
ncbi:MAG TPA: zf-HC2 domain-containing protein [Planctomycetota bacterium]|nr:zf-HC2 domain-containing protein [Planctomycetota bacterium]